MRAAADDRATTCRAVMALEEELFAPDPWTEAMYRDELARARHPLLRRGRARRGEDDEGDGPVMVGYAGLIAYDDEAHVPTIGVDRGAAGRGHRRAAARRAARRGRPAQPASCCSRCAPTTSAAQRLYQRRGFAEIGLRRGYYQPSGADAVVMRRKRVRR